MEIKNSFIGDEHPAHRSNVNPNDPAKYVTKVTVHHFLSEKLFLTRIRCRADVSTPGAGSAHPPQDCAEKTPALPICVG